MRILCILTLSFIAVTDHGAQSATAAFSPLGPELLPEHASQQDRLSARARKKADLARDYSGRFNVKHYGATGDGVADDTAAVNRAIRVAGAGGGGEVYFPNGTYKLRRSVYDQREQTIEGRYADIWITHSNISLVGESKHGTVIRHDRSGGPAMLFWFGSLVSAPVPHFGHNVRVENLTLDGAWNGTMGDNSAAWTLLDLARNTNNVIQHVVFANASEHGLDWEQSGGWGSSVTDCVFTNIRNAAIHGHLSGGKSGWIAKIARCVFVSCATGMTLAETGNYPWEWNGAIDYIGSEFFEVEDCSFFNNPRDISVQGPIRISRCNFNSGSANTNIVVKGGTGWIIENNYFWNAAPGSTALLVETNRWLPARPSRDGRFADNLVKSSRVRVISGDNLTFSGNVFAGSSQVIFHRGNNSIVSGNSFFRNARLGFEAPGSWTNLITDNAWIGGSGGCIVAQHISDSIFAGNLFQDSGAGDPTIDYNGSTMPEGGRCVFRENVSPKGEFKFTAPSGLVIEDNVANKASFGTRTNGQPGVNYIRRNTFAAGFSEDPGELAKYFRSWVWEANRGTGLETNNIGLRFPAGNRAAGIIASVPDPMILGPDSVWLWNSNSTLYALHIVNYRYVKTNLISAP